MYTLHVKLVKWRDGVRFGGVLELVAVCDFHVLVWRELGILGRRVVVAI